jgi:hypothetical protein
VGIAKTSAHVRRQRKGNRGVGAYVGFEILNILRPAAWLRVYQLGFAGASCEGPPA